MNEALLELKNKIASFSQSPLLSAQDLEVLKSQTTVVFMAGGMSSRFTEVSSTQKSSFELPNGDTMIEMALKMYKNHGFNKFAVLVSYQAEEIINRLGNGSKYGVEIKYSHDPKGSPIGKGGAMRNALENKTINNNDMIIIHNPDDVIVNFSDFPEKLLSTFGDALKKGYEAMVVVVSETPYEFSGMQVIDSQVTQIEMYPKVPIPAHIGVTVISPEIFKYFAELFNYEQKTDFEKVLFPILTKNKKLYAMEIPEESWIAVNNLKSYNKLISKLEFL